MISRKEVQREDVREKDARRLIIVSEVSEAPNRKDVARAVGDDCTSSPKLEYMLLFNILDGIRAL